MINNLLRYPGGKTRAIKIIIDNLPFYIKKLCSPFFGGGSVELYLSSKNVKINAYDSFHSLIMFWKYVKNNPIELSSLIKNHFPLTKEKFYNLQEKMIDYENNKTDNIDVAVSFFVLNRASFSGSTLSGGWSPNSPRFTLSSIEKIEKINLENINFECLDFEQSISLNNDKFLYCDPPYHLEKTKSNLYGVKGNLHRNFNHEKLFDILNNRDKWLLSYNDDEFIRNLYKDYKIETVKWNYGLGNDKKSREILIFSKN